MIGAKISTRVWLSFGALLFILVVALVVYEWQVQRVNSRIKHLTEVQQPVEQAVQEMQNSSVLIARSVSDYAREKDPGYIEQLRSSETNLTGASVKFDGLVKIGEDTSQSLKIDSLNTELIKSADHVISLVDQQQAAYLSVRKNIKETDASLQGMLAAYLQEYSPDSNQKLAIVFNMHNDLETVSTDIEAYLIQPAPGTQQEVLNTGEDFKRLTTSLQMTNLSPLESSWLKHMNDQFAELVSNSNNLFVASDGLTSGIRQFQNLFNVTETTLEQQVQPLASTGSLSSVEALKASISSAGVWVIILGIIGIIAGTAAAIVISRRITRPIQKIVSTAELVGSGRIENRFNTEAKGEFGQVALSLNKMLDHFKRSQDALSESEELAWALLDSIHDAVVLIDIKGIILASNETAGRRFGRSLEQMIDVSYYDLLSAESAASLRAHVAEVLNTHKSVHYEDEPENKIIEHDIFPVLERRGEISRLAVFSRDITMRKWVEDVTDQLGRRNALILESAGEGIFGLDTEGRTTFVNPAGARALGYKPEELKGKKHHDLVHHSRPDGKLYPHEQCPIYAAFKDGTIHYNIDNEVFWRKDGTSFQVEYASTPIVEDGRILGAVVTFKDISDRKRVEKTLRESEEKYRSIIESAASLILWLDRDGTVTDSDARLEQFLGYTTSEIVGRPFSQLFHPADRGRVEEILKEIIAGAPEHDYHLRLMHQKGSYIEVVMNVEVARDASGNYARTICMIRFQ
jgi:PAS domain S-box-containing protein